MMPAGIDFCSLQIHLVGTAHVSKASADEVRDKILSVKPATIFLELDQGRANRLMGEEKEPTFNFQAKIHKCIAELSQLHWHKIMLNRNFICRRFTASALLCMLGYRTSLECLEW